MLNTRPFETQGRAAGFVDYLGDSSVSEHRGGREGNPKYDLRIAQYNISGHDTDGCRLFLASIDRFKY